MTNLNQSNHDGLSEKIIKQTTSTTIERLKKCDYFTVDYYAIKNKETFNVNEESFKVLMLIVGNAAVSTGEETVFLEQGESIFLSAGDYEVSVTGICEFLIVSLWIDGYTCFFVQKQLIQTCFFVQKQPFSTCFIVL